MLVILIGHQKRMGKDTFAKYLKTHLNMSKSKLDIRRIGFADKVKDIAFSIYCGIGLQQRQYYDENPEYIMQPLSLDEQKRTVRQIWIDVGQSLRTRDDNVWTNFALNNKADILIIPDFRFLNEYKQCERKVDKVITVKITRPSIVPTNDEADSPLLNFADWDEVIVNDGTPGDLSIKAIQFAQRWNI